MSIFAERRCFLRWQGGVPEKDSLLENALPLSALQDLDLLYLCGKNVS